MSKCEEYYSKMAERIAAMIPLAEKFLEIAADDILNGRHVCDVPEAELSHAGFYTNNRCANVYSFENICKMLKIDKFPVELEHLLCEGTNIYRFNIRAYGDDKSKRYICISRPNLGMMSKYLCKYESSKFQFDNGVLF